MKADSFAPPSKIKRLFIGFLIIWMSGLALLFCCTAASAQKEAAEHCSLAKKGHCAKSSEPKDSPSSKLELSLNNNSAIDCCAFLSNLFNKVRKTEKPPEMAAFPEKAITTPPTFVSISAFKLPPASFYQSPIINRRKSYIKNQVFRI